MRVGLALLAALCAPAGAISPDDRVVAELSDGRVVEGWYFGAMGGVLQLTAAGEVVAVPLSLVDHATVDGVALTGAELRADIAASVVPLPPGPTGPGPGGALSLSLTWPGLGHAALGDWGAAAGYAGVTAVLWGTGIWAVQQEQLGVLVPLVGLDLLFRGWSAAEARRIALRRRGAAARAEAEATGPPRASRGGLTAPAAGE